MNYSVLMSVYKKESSSFFEQAICSILNQTFPTNDFVIICDGDLTDELYQVINKYESNPIFHIIRLKENSGLGIALSVGIKECKNEFVMRMDSDDISLPNRAEVEIPFLEQGYDIVGSAISEFIHDNPESISGYRVLPEDTKSILKFSKKRNPFNHPSVCFKKTVILNNGGYQHFPFFEDYYLWIRCIFNGAKCLNLRDSLVNMRSGRSMRKRRSGKVYRKSVYLLFKFMRKNKYISCFRKWINIMNYDIYSILPIGLKEYLTKHLLRK